MLRITGPWLVVLLAAGPGLAADGAREINQACVSMGCFSGDAPGFPVTIGSAGSYVLTSNLSALSDIGIGGGQDFLLIEITADGVSLDLGGFSLSCRQPSIPPFPCSGVPTPGGDGVRSSGRATRVFNGTVQGLADDGLDLGEGAIVEDVRAFDNANAGIRVSQSSVVRQNTSLENGGDGIVAEVNSVVVENTSSENGDDGFVVSFSSTVSRNTASNNGGDGFDLGRISGFSGVAGGIASENAADLNDGLGLRLEPAWGYTRNVLTQNNGGNANPQVGGSGIDLGANVCGGNTSCP